MKHTFFKYQGTGNDFVMIDNRQKLFDKSNTKHIAFLCDRRFGIGADGLILLENHDELDFKMVYYNADGQPSSMCGNGGRCAVAFAKKLGIINNETTFLAVDGPHYAHSREDGSWVSLQMIDVSVLERDGEAWVLNTGSPHFVSQVQNLSQLDVYACGKAIRYNNTYAEKGINVNFIEEDAVGYAVRTYERGVEDETLACGTGVTAVALAMAKEKGLIGTQNTPISVRGGALNVRFTFDGSTFTEVFLEGPATLVFEGEIQH